MTSLMRREDSPGVAGEGVDSARAVRDRGLDTVTIAQRHNTTQVLHLAAAEMVRHDVERAGDEEDHLLARVTPQDRELSLGASPDVEHLIHRQEAEHPSPTSPLPTSSVSSSENQTLLPRPPPLPSPVASGTQLDGA